MYPPSMIAAASVSAAATGFLGSTWVAQFRLFERLQQITTIDAVSITISNTITSWHIKTLK